MKWFPRSSPYWPVLTHPRLRKVLPGLVISGLGDGMSIVAVSWLALRLAPAANHGTWVAVAVAAYALPSVAGGVLLGRFLSGRGGAQLAGWDATLRAVALAAVALAHAVGVLDMTLYIALLAISSLLAAWGSAGRYTLVAELLPGKQHLPANAVLTVIAELTAIVGPPLAGILIATTGAAAVIAVDAASFAVLAVTYRIAVPAAARPERTGASRAAGFRAIRQDRTLLGLLVLTFGFMFVFGPLYVALPVHVVEDLGASATMLGGYFTAFGAGAVVGGLLAGHLRDRPLWPTVAGTVLASGTAMLPLGLGAPAPVALAGVAVAGIVWAPFMPTTMALYQRRTPADRLAPVLAANGSVLEVAVPLGTVLGGPLVTALGAQLTLLAIALATLALGVVTAVAVLRPTLRRAA
jgi:predicted MFS family arabinose efflux permease